MRTAPFVGRKSPPTIDSSVVLPDPEGPSISTTSPPLTDRLALSTAVTADGPSPKVLVKPSVTTTLTL
jgi:hypothetical protein